jgi:hypothetical protein
VRINHTLYNIISYKSLCWATNFHVNICIFFFINMSNNINESVHSVSQRSVEMVGCQQKSVATDVHNFGTYLNL